MKKNGYLFLWVVFWVIQSSFGQFSEIFIHQDRTYQKALSLYKNKQYQAAQALFEKVKNQAKDTEVVANCAYYIANTAIRLNQPGADTLMGSFVKQYPTSTKRNGVFLDVANYYFHIGKYSYALKWYRQVAEDDLSYDDTNPYNFNIGYAFFITKKYKEAKRYLKKVIRDKTYGNQATYYLGYIAYQKNDYEVANAYFDQITDVNTFNKKLSYYKVDMNFKSGRFQKAIDLGLKQLSNSNKQESSELHKIIGESYFNLKQYKKAIPHLEKYKGEKGKWRNTDYYLLGYSYYHQQDFKKAVGQFNKIIGERNAVSQNAYYHLGACYLKLGQKQEALNAFRNASQTQFNATIEKDAWLNYARLSYDIGNVFESVLEVLTNYLKKYPKSPHKQEIEELLLNSYVTSKNYELALKLLENNESFSAKNTYQKVAFYRGVELFRMAKYKDAYSYFDKVVRSKKDQWYTARAVYWKGEIAYLQSRWEEAIVGFKTFGNQVMAVQTPEYKNWNYHLAYAYFKKKNYTKAIEFFKKFIAQKPKNKVKLGDAYLRIGDAQFINSSYWAAMEFYNKAIALGGKNSDYATFQKSISYGFVDRTNKKIESLQKFTKRFPKSTLRDDALYELGNSYVKIQKETEGLAAYEKLIQTFKKSSFVSKALLKQGLVYYNKGDHQKALLRFKKIVASYPNSTEALQAVSTAKLIYIDLGKVEEYAAWVKNLNFVEVSDIELDNANFESVERQYTENKTEVAIDGFQNYLKNYPDGIHALKANFYLAELYFGQGKKDKAINNYSYVINKEQNEFTEPSLVRLAEIYLATDRFESTIPILIRLEKEAEFDQNITFAQSNLMKGYYEQGNYDKTLIYADKVLANSKIEKSIQRDAYIMKARSFMATGRESKAEKSYAEVEKIATGIMVAEALYYKAYFLNKKEAYKKSNEVIQQLAQNYGNYKEYSAKALLIMANNFDALGDVFQAIYTLESTISNFTEFKDIINQAKVQIKKFKAREEKRNASVNPSKN